MTNKRMAWWAAGVAGIAAGLTGVVLATPGFGAVGTIVARAAFADPTSIVFRIKDDHGGHGHGGKRREVIQAHNAQDTVMQQITFAPGGHTGWHSHPGPVVVLVTQGELTLFSSEDETCTGRTYFAGQSFIDSGQGHVHIGRASATGNTVLWVTYFDVPPGESVRVDAADPGNCAF